MFNKIISSFRNNDSNQAGNKNSQSSLHENISLTYDCINGLLTGRSYAILTSITLLPTPALLWVQSPFDKTCVGRPSPVLRHSRILSPFFSHSHFFHHSQLQILCLRNPFRDHPVQNSWFLHISAHYLFPSHLLSLPQIVFCFPIYYFFPSH